MYTLLHKLNHVLSTGTYSLLTLSVLIDVHTLLQEYYEIKWWQPVSRTEAVRGRGRNKLRTCCKFQTSMTAESYVKVILPKGHWSA